MPPRSCSIIRQKCMKRSQIRLAIWKVVHWLSVALKDLTIATKEGTLWVHSLRLTLTWTVSWWGSRTFQIRGIRKSLQPIFSKKIPTFLTRFFTQRAAKLLLNSVPWSKMIKCSQRRPQILSRTGSRNRRVVYLQMAAWTGAIINRKVKWIVCYWIERLVNLNIVWVSQVPMCTSTT